MARAGTRTIAIGEAMIEMAVVGDRTYRSSFAGDTFNTAWHLTQLLGPDHQVGFATKVGTDSLSESFVQELQQDVMDTSCIGRDPDRRMGLYMIELDGTERRFHYWRSQSAARQLADDPDWLMRALGAPDVIHLSGITLAILSPEARESLLGVLASARRNGAKVSFDPNVRPALWDGPDDARDAIKAVLGETDIAFPSFDDEAGLWGDATPQDTCKRYQASGVNEVVVKNGDKPVTLFAGGAIASFETAPVDSIRDTSGAGDAFNAGYLAGYLLGLDRPECVARGQNLSGQVIGQFGARIPKDQIVR